MTTQSMFPFVSFDSIDIDAANDCLVRWGHKMGPFNRPDYGDIRAHALYHEGNPVAVTISAGLVRDHVGGGLSHLTRNNTIELARLCADRPHLCRVALRLWREFAFPALNRSCAISYQDADIHNGQTYRFDGWGRAAFSKGGTTDQRTGRKGRNRWIWTWPASAAVDSHLRCGRLLPPIDDPCVEAFGHDGPCRIVRAA